MASSWRQPRVEPYTRSDDAARLELGCGPNKLHPDAIGVDVLDLPGVDIVGPIPDVLTDLDDASVDVIFTRHFLEHVDSLTGVVAECARLLRPGGRLIAITPHFANPHFYSDPTHRTAFGLYTMSYLALDDLHRRAVPRYVEHDEDVRFRLVSVDLHFDRSLRRPVGYLLGRAMEAACRRSSRWREFYEYRLAWLFPCHELRYELERR
ncbi:MAG: class I SAM-dependent methyltransferase [Actinomycetota bacterium]